MMRTYLLLLVAVLIAASATGCVTYAAGIAPSNIPLGDPTTYELRGTVSGSSTGVNLFGIPFKQASLESALRSAKGNNYALAEICVTNRDYFLFIIWLQKIRVTGTVVHPRGQ